MYSGSSAGVASSVNSATTQANQFANNISNNLKSVAPNLDTSTITNAVQNAGDQINDTIESVQKFGMEFLSKGTSLLDGVAGAVDVANSLTSMASTVFENIPFNISALNQLPANVAHGLKEPDTLIKSLASNSAEAIANPVAFISKPFSNALSEISDLGSSTANKLLSSISDDVISQLSAGLGVDITNESDLRNAIISASNEFVNNVTNNSIGSIISSANSVINSGKTAIDEFTSSLTSGLDSTLKNFTSVIENSGIDDIIDMGSEISDTILNKLPDELSSWISSTSDAFVTSQLDKILDSFNDTTKDILGKLNGLTDISEIQDILMSLPNSNKYPAISDASGGSLSSSYGDNSEQDINLLYEAAKTVCAGVEKDSTVNYRKMKDEFDLLLALSIRRGMIDLAKQLMICNGGSAAYFDQRSIDTLRSLTAKLVGSGDAIGYETVASIIGTNNLQDTDTELLVLGANMQATNGNITAYNKVLNSLKTSVVSLVTDDAYIDTGLQPFIANNVVLMSATNTAVIDDAIGAENRQLVGAVMSAYA